MEDEVRMLELAQCPPTVRPAGSWREETTSEFGTVELHV